MQAALRSDDRIETVRADFQRTIMVGFCGALRSTQLPPLAVLELIATALGSVYEEVASAHRGSDPCPCGWRPDRATDIGALQAAVAALAPPPAANDLSRMEPAGRA
jgi:hypothetical protein